MIGTEEPARRQTSVVIAGAHQSALAWVSTQVGFDGAILLQNLHKTIESSPCFAPNRPPRVHVLMMADSQEMLPASTYYDSSLLQRDNGVSQDASPSDESGASDGDGPRKKRKRPVNVTKVFLSIWLIPY